MADTDPERVLVDTQIVVLAYLGEDLPSKVQSLLTNPSIERQVSSVSLVEIAIKSASGKIELTTVDLLEAVRDLALTVIPFNSQHAIRMFSLPAHHRDPFDRMIIATALSERIPLVGGDQQFRRYAGLNVIW